METQLCIFHDIISEFMREPYLPVSLDIMHASLNFYDVKEGAEIDLDEIVPCVDEDLGKTENDCCA